jgi:hypothetical protein
MPYVAKGLITTISQIMNSAVKLNDSTRPTMKHVHYWTLWLLIVVIIHAFKAADPSNIPEQDCKQIGSELYHETAAEMVLSQENSENENSDSYESQSESESAHIEFESPEEEADQLHDVVIEEQQAAQQVALKRYAATNNNYIAQLRFLCKHFDVLLVM